MEQQLPLFSSDLPDSAQQTIREALTLLEHQLREPGVPFLSASATRDWLRLNLAGQEREMFVVLFLDNQHRLITHETLFSGTINHTQVHPREVVKAALKHNAAAMLVAHCHPSGHAEPSDADRRITERLRQALDLVDIRLLDHLVVGGMEIVSLAERGWL
ncbi:TPA: DNA repair protein RadC [Citrobacter freundii]